MSWGAFKNVREYSRAKGPARCVLYLIADHVNDGDGGEAWPSQATLARECGLSRKTVNVAIKKLVEMGELEIVRQGRPGKGSSRYRVLVCEDTYRDAEAGDGVGATHSRCRRVTPYVTESNPVCNGATHNPLSIPQLSSIDPLAGSDKPQASYADLAFTGEWICSEDEAYDALYYWNEYSERPFEGPLDGGLRRKLWKAWEELEECPRALETGECGEELWDRFVARLTCNPLMCGESGSGFVAELPWVLNNITRILTEPQMMGRDAQFGKAPPKPRRDPNPERMAYFGMGPGGRLASVSNG